MPEVSFDGRTAADRATHIAQLVSGMRLEGLEPIGEFFALSELYISGLMTLDEVVLRCRRNAKYSGERGGAILGRL